LQEILMCKQSHCTDNVSVSSLFFSIGG